MARSNINYHRKRNELIKEIWDIFLRYGYENTTLSLIIKELKISKGAFYHYFSTKEACADAAVEAWARTCRDEIVQHIDENAPADINLKNLFIFCSELAKKNEINIENINAPSNAIFHQKLMAALVKELAPIYAKVISQGVEEKIFDTQYPLETAQMILTLSNFYFDSDLFGWEPKEMSLKLLAFKDLVTLTLKTGPKLFSFIQDY